MIFIAFLRLVQACIPITCDLGLNSSLCLLSDYFVYVSSCETQDGVARKCALENIQEYLSDDIHTSISCNNVTETDSSSYKDQNTGYPCVNDEDCKSLKCVDSRCEGKGYKQTCTEDSECQPDMYCKPDYGYSYCITALTKDSYCDFDNECASGLGCSRGKCVKLMSLEVGELTDISVFCKSLIKNSLNYCDALEIYIKDQKLQSPYPCKQSDTCIYRFVNSKLDFNSLPCQCDGYNDENTGYCGTYVNYTQEYTSALANNLNYDSSICSGDDASSTDPDVLYQCQSISESQYNYYKNWTATALYWSLFNSHAIDDCAEGLGIFSPGWTWNGAEFIAFVAWFGFFI